MIGTVVTTITMGLAALGACQGPGIPIVENPKPVAAPIAAGTAVREPRPVVVYTEGEVIPPLTARTRLDLIMLDTEDEGGPRVRCMNRGGTPTPRAGSVLCVEVDK